MYYHYYYYVLFVQNHKLKNLNSLRKRRLNPENPGGYITVVFNRCAAFSVYPFQDFATRVGMVTRDFGKFGFIFQNVRVRSKGCNLCELDPLAE
jgi:hypothetical protein